MALGNKFVNKKIGGINQYKDYSDIIKNKNTKKNKTINIFITIFCIFIIGYFSKFIIQAGSSIFSFIGNSTVSVVSKTIGKVMKQDEFGNINVMIIGYGGAKHSGGYLADSIIVASFNPKLGAVTMLSTPRDLFIYNKEEQILGRINQVFSRGVSKKHEFETGANIMIKQLETIIGLKIPYYVLIDFQGFEQIIDTLGGIKINVPKKIVDSTYPDGKMGYLTFKVNSGVNLFDGKTALMYARSRHSTSDFDRSKRQQQIIQAVKDSFLSKGLTPNKIKQLYSDYTKIVKTNITMNELIGLSQYMSKLKNIFTFGFTTECSNLNYKLSHPGCFLYTPNRDLFGGASVILPVGGDNLNPNFYEYMQKFALNVFHNQDYLIEKANIVVWNSIDKKYSKSIKTKQDGFANKLAVKLKKYAYNISNVKNSINFSSGTVLYIVGTGKYDNTIRNMRGYVSIDNIININESSDIGTGLLNELYKDQMSGADLVLSLGNSYLDYLQIKKFDYYK